MKKLAYGVAALGVLGVVVLGVVYLVVVHPWVAEPDASPEEIARRWDQVEAWAALDPACQEGGEGLRHAIRAVDEGWWEVEDRMDAGDGARIPRDELPFGLRTAVDGLVGWHHAGEGIGVEGCFGDTSLVGQSHLAQLALASADGAGSGEVEAVLALGQWHRRCGGILGTTLGLVFAEDAVIWARARGVTADATFERYRPTADEVFEGLAREALCSAELAEEAFGMAGLGHTSTGAPDLAMPLIDLERELRMLRLFHIERLEAADAAGRDLATMAGIYHWEEQDDLPRSLLVRMAALSPGFLDRMGQYVATYDAFLAGEPTPY